MAQYVVFTQLTTEGRKRVRAHPDAVKEAARRVEQMGAKITSQYAVLGGADFVTVLEAPDNVAVERIKAELSSLGTMRNTTYPAIGMQRFTQMLKVQPYRTEPHYWQTSWWARILRRAGRYWVTTRHVNKYCKPLTIEGRENLKGFKGGSIVIANHSSHFDSPVVITALPEQIRGKLLAAAAADKFFPYRRKRHWWYSLFAGAFPVHRGGGTKQLDYPMSLLKRGWSILIYPEGGRSKSGQVARFKAGPAIMAMQGHVPVIPIYIEGLRNVMPKGQRTPQPAAVYARIGKPVSLEGITSIAEANTLLENALRALAGQAPHHHMPEHAGEAVVAAASASGGGAS